MITQSSGGPMLTFNVAGATEAEAKARFRAMTEALIAAGNPDIAMRSVFQYTGVGDTYKVVAGDGVAQTVAEHEAGHMLAVSPAARPVPEIISWAPGPPVPATPDTATV